MRHLIAIAAVMATANCVWVEKTVKPTSNAAGEVTISTYSVEPGNSKSEPVVTTEKIEKTEFEDKESRGFDKANGQAVPGTEKGRRDLTGTTTKNSTVTTKESSGGPSAPRITAREERHVANPDSGDTITISGFMSSEQAISLYQSEAATRAALADKQLAFDRTRNGFEQRNVVGTNGAVLPNQNQYGFGMYGMGGNGWQGGLSPASQRMMARDQLQQRLGSTFAPPQIPVSTVGPGTPTGNQPPVQVNGQPGAQSSPAVDEKARTDAQDAKRQVEELSAGFAAFMSGGDAVAPAPTQGKEKQ